MKHFYYLLLLIFSGLFCPDPAFSQSQTPYHINGSAQQENCNCYTLTPNQINQSGSVWNINKIDLRQSFEFVFNVFLGCNDASGADGIVFVLQPISTSVGSTGSGMGYENISPSIGITIDTWLNSERADPAYDHVAIHRDGDIHHNSVNNLAGPVQALANSANIEDCQWHTFRIIWNHQTKLLKALIDEVDRVETTIDLVNSVFGGDPFVYWGFTGATGGSTNHQRVCTSLNPGFTFPEDQTTCYPEPVQFIDSSASFGTIVKYFWDFGDGNTDTVAAPPPHVYSAPGIYEAKLQILGNNGCLSETFTKQIVIGSKPVADFKPEKDVLCEGDTIRILDTSYVEFGTINNWNWSLDGNSVQGSDPGEISVPGAGTVPVDLRVETLEGCISDPVSKTVNILEKPRIEFSVQEECLNIPSVFTANSLPGSVPVLEYHWFVDGIQAGTGNQAQYLFPAAGNYNISLLAAAQNGCTTTAGPEIVTAFGTNAFAGNDTTIADTQPLQLQASGGEFYSWSPATGLSDPNIADPVARISSNQSYVLTASSARGCETKDTINIQVYKGPDFYIPNAFTPNNDGKNDLLRFVSAGISKIDYFRIYNRYGQLIFSSADINGAWDGTIKGKQQASGTYVWMRGGIDFNGNAHTKKGTVTLIR